MKISSEILRVYKVLHTWVGITAGVFLFIGFLAGSLTMFKHAIDQWVSPPAHSLPMVSEQQLDPLVSMVLSTYPDAKKRFIVHLKPDESAGASVVWFANASPEKIDVSKIETQASLNDSGELYTQQLVPSLLAQLIDMLHRTAGIPFALDHGWVGEYVMGVASVLYFLALVSGLILLLPLLVKDLFLLRSKKGPRRFWLDAHNIIGITSLPFHIVISLTTLVFVFHDQFYDGLAATVYGEKPLFSSVASTKKYTSENMLPVSELLNRVRQEAPDFTIEEMRFFNLDSTRPMLRVALVNPEYLVRGPQSGYLSLHPYTGDVINNHALPGHNVWGSITSTFFALHFGSYGGDLTRWVYFLLGLSGAFLFYSGNLLWIDRRRQKSADQQLSLCQPRSVRLLATATVGVCLGAIVGICLTLVAAKWLYIFFDNVNSYYLLTYYSGFFLTIAFAFLQGAASASYQLLRLCAGLTLAIPATSLVAYLFPGLGMWVHTSVASLGVDFVALLASFFFLYVSNVTWRRARFGPVDSVWSLQSPVHEPVRDSFTGKRAASPMLD